jgi:hypothetical protein
MYAQLIQGGTLAGIAAISTGNRSPKSVWEVNARA